MPLSKITNPFLDPAGAARSNVYSPAANTIGIVTSGTEKVRVDSGGNVSVGGTSTVGKVNITGADNQGMYIQQNNTDNGWLFGTSSADGVLRVQRRGEGVSPTNNERFSIIPEGQMYHNSTYLLGSSYNCYHAKMQSAVNVSTSFQDTGVTWSGVYIPTNVRKMLFWYNAAIRNNGLNQCHIAFRLRVINNATSGVSYVGNSSWGFGINMPIDSGKNHFQINQHVNIFDYATDGNQAGFAAGQTYTIHLQVTDSSASGGNLKLGGDMAYQTYTPVHGTIWII
jgi:hypothetical protein